MKVKLINKSSNLPNCWKQCGASKEDWDNLQSGETVELKNIFIGIKHLVEEASSTQTKGKKGDK